MLHIPGLLSNEITTSTDEPHSAETLDAEITEVPSAAAPTVGIAVTSKHVIMIPAKNLVIFLFIRISFFKVSINICRHMVTAC